MNDSLRSVGDWAASTVDALEVVNRAALEAGELQIPELDRLLVLLARLVHGLEDLNAQLTRNLEKRLEGGALRFGGPSPYRSPAAAVNAAVMHLTRSGVIAGDLASSIDQAHRIVSTIADDRPTRPDHQRVGD